MLHAVQEKTITSVSPCEGIFQADICVSSWSSCANFSICIWIASVAWAEKAHFKVNSTMVHWHSFTLSKREDSRLIWDIKWSNCVHMSVNPLNHAALTCLCIHIVSVQPPLWPPWLCARITLGWPLTWAWWGVSPPTTSPCSSGRLSPTLQSVFTLLFHRLTSVPQT